MVEEFREALAHPGRGSSGAPFSSPVPWCALRAIGLSIRMIVARAVAAMNGGGARSGGGQSAAVSVVDSRSSTSPRTCTSVG